MAGATAPTDGVLSGPGGECPGGVSWDYKGSKTLNVGLVYFFQTSFFLVQLMWSSLYIEPELYVAPGEGGAVEIDTLNPKPKTLNPTPRTGLSARLQVAWEAFGLWDGDLHDAGFVLRSF